ncbi:MAG: tandem-95 repeat protein [Bacteroidetes bacterium]|nr:tandem-95 repeat protein [Bacteroidota bacterium]
MTIRSYSISVIFVCTIAANLCSQTPGLIFDPATGSGAAVLDPNSDGYTSQTTAGFIADDQAESELPFIAFVFPGLEPTSDLGPGPDCGFTDFVDEGDEDPAQYYIDGSDNWLIRLRMGKALTNSKSYSILIDSDQKFGATGPNADPNYVTGNPGFEIELVLATNFGVYVYDVDGTASPTLKRTYAGHDNYQKSIALTTNCGDPDYFYDFFVPFGDLTADFGITTSTPLRIVIIDNMAAQASSIGQPSSRSDLGGVDDAACGFNYESCFGDVIDNYTPCAPDGSPCPDRSLCPTITGPISNGATTVSGTSTEPDGTTIKVYKNRSLIGTTTVGSGTWALTGIAPSLASNDSIEASATATGEGESIKNCDLTIVAQICTAPITSATACNAGKAFQGLGIAGAVINVYYGASSTPLTPNSGYNYSSPPNTITAGTVPSTLNPTSDNWLWRCLAGGQTTSCTAGGAPCVSDGQYRITQQSPGQCESDPYYLCFGGGGTSATPSITTNPVLTTTTSVSGTVAAPDNIAGVSIVLYSNGAQIATGTTIAGGSWTINSLSLTARACESLTAKVISGTKCISSASGSVTINATSAAPVVTGTYCTATTISSVSGTSTESAGTVIQVYENGVAEGASTTVASNGTWTANSGISIAPGNTITARATSSCGVQSGLSNSIVVGNKTTNSVTITSSPITEGDASVNGTGTNGDDIRLYIDGIRIGGIATVAGGIWTIGGLGPYDLYTDGVVYATATSPGNCESDQSNTVTVLCVLPSTGLTVDPTDTTVCSGSVVANIRVLASQSLTIYQLFNGLTPTGSSKLGTGSTITLTSGTLTASTTIKVKGIKIPVGSCSSTLADTVPVTVNAIPDLGLTVGVSSNPICENNSTNITVALSQVGFTYQLRDDADNSNVGSAVGGTGGTINLPTGNLTATTTFNVYAQGAAPSNCSGELTTLQTVTVSAGPDLGLSVGVTTNPICYNTSTNITVALSQVGFFYQLRNDADDSNIGAPVAGTGGTINLPTGNLTNNTTFNILVSGACTGELTTTLTVTLNSLPTPTFTAAPTPVCINSTGNIYSTQAVMTNYSWSISGGTITSGGTATDNSVTVTWTSSGSQSVSVNYTDGNGCTAASATSQNVTVNSLPTPTFTAAPTPVCLNSTGNIYSTQAAMTNYSWSISGGTITSGGTATDNSATVTWTSSGSQSVSVNYTDGNGCTAGSATSQSVTVDSLPTPTFTAAPTPVCINSTGNIYSTQAAMTNYSWSISGGTITSGGTATDNSATVTWTSSGSQSVSVNYTDGNGCTAASATSQSVTVNSLPTPSFTAAPTPVCLNSTGNIYSTQAAMTNYSWSISGGTITSGGTATDNSATVTWTSTGSQSISVNYTDGNGCTAASATSQNVTVNSLPTPTFTAAPTPVCLNSTGNIYSTQAAMTNYSWSISGGTITSGGTATDNSATVTWTSSGSQSISVNYTDGNGCTAASATSQSVTVNATPDTGLVVTITVNPICTGTSTDISVSFSESGFSYQLRNDADDSNIGSPVAGTGGTINLPTGNISSTTTFNILATGNCNRELSAKPTVTIISVTSANAGTNQNLSCGTTNATLSGNTPSAGTGTWSLISGTGTVSIPSDPNSPVTGLSSGINTFRWTISNPPCADSYDDVNINIVCINLPPDAQNDTLIIPEDNPVTSIDVQANDSDPNGDSLTTSIIINSVNGIAVLNGNNIDYAPNPDFYGNDTIVYSVCDTATPALCDTAIVIITVTPINDKPDITDSTGNPIDTIFEVTDEDTPVTICLHGLDIDGDDLDVTGVAGGPINGIISGLSDGDTCFTYTPDPDFNGKDTVEIILCDNGAPSLCDTVIAIITVNPVNDPPSTPDTTVTTPEDTPVTICINISDPDTGSAFIRTLCGVSNGTAASSVTGNLLCVLYTPDAGYNGTDSVCMVICDNGTPTLCDTVIIGITVTPVNDSPVAMNDSLIISEDGLATTIDVRVNDSDPDGDPLTTSIISGPANGNAAVIGNNIEYSPDPDFNGNDTVVYIICDNGTPVLCDTAIVIITVLPVNDAPDAVTDIDSTFEDTPLTVDVQANDSDVDGDPLITSVIATASNGMVSILNMDSLYYNPNTGFTGTDTIIYRICDNGLPPLCDADTVFITVININNAPVALDDYSTTDPLVADTVDVLINDMDPDGDSLFVSIVAQPDSGSATISGNGQIIYITNGTFINGIDTVTYAVCDNGSPQLCDTALVIIWVPLNSLPPMARDDYAATPEDQPVTVNVLFNDADPNIPGDTLSVAILTGPTNGTAFVTTDNKVTYTPALNYNGQDTMMYLVCDTANFCDTAVVILTVTPINDAPDAVADYDSTLMNTPVTVDVQINDSDPEGGTLVTSVTGLPANGNVSVLNGDSIVYSPDTGFSGIDFFVYEICDNGVPTQCDDDTVFINIISLNNPPIAVNDTLTISEDAAITSINVQSNDTDVDGDPLTTAIINLPGNGTASINGNNIDYTPDPDFNGQDSIVYEICDNGIPSLCDTAIVIIKVMPVPDTTYSSLNETACDSFMLNSQTYTSGGIYTQTLFNSEGGDSIITLNLTILQSSSSTLNETACDSFTLNSQTYNVSGIYTQTLVNAAGCDSIIALNLTINSCNNNNPPSVTDTSGTTPQDSSVTICTTVNDPDAGSTFTAVLCGVNNGTALFSISGNQLCVTYTPNSGFTGMDTVCVIVCDNGTPSLCDTTYIPVYVTPVIIPNNPPVVTDTIGTTPQDSSVTICTTVNDPDAGSTFTAILCGVNNGTASVTITGNQLCVTYTPNSGFTGMDTVCVIVCDNGTPSLCDTAKVNITVTYTPPYVFFIPEGFSPNGDGENDYFEILGIDKYPGNNIMIFNRWGNLIFEKDGYNNEWDGTYQGGFISFGSKLPAGTYFYVLKLDKDSKPVKGYVYLNR